MEIYLNVQTVQTFDRDKSEMHTAYTVYHPTDEALEIASGWTLRDAVDLFARIYRYNRSQLKLMRPFRQQRIYNRFV